MTLIDGDKIVTAQLYDDEHEEFTEEQMSIIDYVNAYTDEGVTTADDVLDKIKAEIKQAADKQFQIAMGVSDLNERYAHIQMENAYRHSLNVIDKYRAESEDKE